jgi:hypothetical protein
MRKPACAGLAALIFLGPASAWSAEYHAHYDPAACKNETHGRMFIALDRNVLAVTPWSDGAKFDPIYPNTIQKLSPPDPQQPEGCPDNPLQLQRYPFNHEADVPRDWGIVPDTGIEMINNHWGTGTGHDTWDFEDDQFRFAQSLCARATMKETLSNGLVACRVTPQRDAFVADWAASYITSPETYATPTGRPFFVYCGPGLFSRGIGSCDVAYRFLPGLDVVYRFQPFRGPRAIPLDHIIEFDRDVRRQIEGELIKDYVWPEQP